MWRKCTTNENRHQLKRKCIFFALWDSFHQTNKTKATKNYGASTLFQSFFLFLRKIFMSDFQIHFDKSYAEKYRVWKENVIFLHSNCYKTILMLVSTPSIKVCSFSVTKKWFHSIQAEHWSWTRFTRKSSPWSTSVGRNWKLNFTPLGSENRTRLCSPQTLVLSPFFWYLHNSSLDEWEKDDWSFCEVFLHSKARPVQGKNLVCNQKRKKPLWFARYQSKISNVSICFLWRHYHWERTWQRNVFALHFFHLKYFL